MYEICKACNTINSRSKISQRAFHISYIFYKSKSFKQRISIKGISRKTDFLTDLSRWVFDKKHVF